MEMKLYTVTEVAEILKVSTRTVWNYIKDNKIETIKFNGNVRIPEAKLNEFINSSNDKNNLK